MENGPLPELEQELREWRIHLSFLKGEKEQSPGKEQIINENGKSKIERFVPLGKDYEILLDAIRSTAMVTVSGFTLPMGPCHQR